MAILFCGGRPAPARPQAHDERAPSAGLLKQSAKSELFLPLSIALFRTLGHCLRLRWYVYLAGGEGGPGRWCRLGRARRTGLAGGQE